MCELHLMVAGGQAWGERRNKLITGPGLAGLFHINTLVFPATGTKPILADD